MENRVGGRNKIGGRPALIQASGSSSMKYNEEDIKKKQLRLTGSVFQCCRQCLLGCFHWVNILMLQVFTCP